MNHALNTSRIIIPLGIYSATANCAEQTDAVAHSLRAYLNVTGIGGTGGLQLAWRGYDKVSKTAVQLSSGGVPVTSPGVYVYEFNPGAIVDPITGLPFVYGAIVEVCPRPLPYQWDVLIIHNDAGAYTYSVSADIIASN